MTSFSCFSCWREHDHQSVSVLEDLKQTPVWNVRQLLQPLLPQQQQQQQKAQADVPTEAHWSTSDRLTQPDSSTLTDLVKHDTQHQVKQKVTHTEVTWSPQRTSCLKRESLHLERKSPKVGQPLPDHASATFPLTTPRNLKDVRM